MTQKTYIVEGRQFRTEADYNRAAHDKAIIDKLRIEIKGADRRKLEELIKDIRSGKYRFMTLLGEDFLDELNEKLRNTSQVSSGVKVKGDNGRNQAVKAVKRQSAQADWKTNPKFEAIVQAELKRQERCRKRLIVLCSLLATGCLGYFGIYSYDNYRTSLNHEKMSALKEKPITADTKEAEPVVHYVTEEQNKPKEVLDEYKNLINKNKKLIGWVKIDDTNIDYPVMQTSDNEYYQDHNMNQEYDRNGSIFMDKDCDVLKPSTNYILYGHHMKSGQMFGRLDLYEDESYFQEHQYIQFDTIYEKGTYQVMYVFRSRVYSEDEIVFKYYQFIDALSEKEFDSNMQEMAKLSLYDTGVTARYGDQLLTLSTCDYQEKNGRFVVVAKKVATKE